MRFLAVCWLGDRLGGCRDASNYGLINVRYGIALCKGVLAGMEYVVPPRRGAGSGRRDLV